MSSYIMKWRDPDKEHRSSRIWLTGPFHSEGLARKWAREDERKDNDFRWQLVILPLLDGAEDSVVIPIESPTKAEAA